MEVASGCGYCHTPSLKTGRSPSAVLNNKTVNLYSDDVQQEPWRSRRGIA
jgi:hypothetical protein